LVEIGVATDNKSAASKLEELEAALVDADVLAQKIFEIDCLGDILPRPTLSDRFRTSKEAKADLEAMN
jgi:hypothetical protein